MSKMKKGVRPGTEMRCEMLNLFLKMGMSPSEMSEHTSQMRDKTEEEKEAIAKKLIEKYKEL